MQGCFSELMGVLSRYDVYHGGMMREEHTLKLRTIRDKRRKNMNKDMTGDCPSCAALQAPSEAVSETLLTHWPIQIKLIGTVAPFLENADLIVAADCTAFSLQGFQEKFLEGKKLLIGCPKLDNAMTYIEKFTEIFSNIPIKSVHCVRMQVPCCGGMTMVLKEALKKSGKNIPLKETVVGIKGEVLSEKEID